MAFTCDSFPYRFWKVLGVLILLVLGPLHPLHSQAPVPPNTTPTPEPPDATSPASPLPPPPGQPSATSPLPPPPTPEPAAPALPPPPPSPPEEEMEPSDNPDEQVRFRFTFEGDTRPPTLGSEPEPPPAPPPPPPNPADYLGHDPNKPVNYSLDDDDEPEEEEPKERAKGGIQWDQLMGLVGKGSDWYLANIIWTGPSSGVLVLGALGLVIVGSVKKKKRKQAIQAQFEERKKLREQRKANPGKRKAVAGVKPKKRAPLPPPPTETVQEVGDHLFLCFTGYDDEPAQALRKALTKSGYDIRCRKLENGAAKIFDNETVELISSARAVLLVASGSAYKSERVLSETQHARDEEKLIVPIYLDDSELPKSYEYLAEDPEYVYFDPSDARNSIREIVAFLANREIPPA